MMSSTQTIRACILATVTCLVIAQTAFATKTQYGVGVECSSEGGLSSWGLVIICNETESTSAQTIRFKVGVEQDAMAAIPTVTFTDSTGSPLILDGTLISVDGSPCASQCEVGDLHPPAPGNVWLQWQSTAFVDPIGDGELAFNVEFTWPSINGPGNGAVWFSDNGDDLYGNEVTDAYSPASDPAAIVPTLSSWGLLALFVTILAIGLLTMQRLHLLPGRREPTSI